MSTFSFKQFDIVQDKVAQKVGTDGVLLGAWCSLDKQPHKILDIGSGTGLISLMCAQRFPQAFIESIEIDHDAFEQTASNFESSKFKDQLYAYHASFQEFYDEVDERYDFMVSNPPFYNAQSIKSDDQIESRRQQARFDDALPFEELFYGVYKLLAIDGTFALVFPVEREERVLEIADYFTMMPTRKMYVRGTVDSSVKRVFMELRFRESVIKSNQKLVTQHMVIEHSRHEYTDEYIALTKDFYLKM